MGSLVIRLAGCLALLVALRHARAQSGSLSCPRGLSPPFAVYGDSCYQFVSTEKTWENARQHCRQQNAVGGKLVSVPDMETQNWIGAFIALATRLRWSSVVWLGLSSRLEVPRFLWDEYDGRDTPGTFFNWSPGEPQFSRNQSCAYMRRQSGWRWAVAVCDRTSLRTFSFICQYSPTGVAIITSATTGVNTIRLSITSAPMSLTLSTPTLKPTSQTLSTDRGLTAARAFTTRHHSNQTVTTPGRAQNGSLSCPRGLSPPFEVYGNSCYQFVPTRKSWEDARRHCQQQNAVGGKLVSVPDMETQNWIGAFIALATRLRWSSVVWLGLSSRLGEPRFLWDEYDGRETPATFFNWFLAHPVFNVNHSCVYASQYFGWTWMIEECNRTPMRAFSFICQYRLTDVAIIPSATAGVNTIRLSSTSAPMTPTLRTPTLKPTSQMLSTDRVLTTTRGFTTLQQNNQRFVTTGRGLTAVAIITPVTAEVITPLFSSVSAWAIPTLRTPTMKPTSHHPSMDRDLAASPAFTTLQPSSGTVATPGRGITSLDMVTAASTAIIEGTGTAPADGPTELSFWVTSHSVYPGLVASSETTASGITPSEMVTEHSTAVNAGTNTVPLAEPDDSLSWFTSHSVYSGLVASSETTASDITSSKIVTGASTAISEGPRIAPADVPAALSPWVTSYSVYPGLAASSETAASGIPSSEIVTAASTAINEGTSTAPEDESDDFSSWVASHSVYPGLVASSEPATSDNRRAFTVASQSTTREMTATAVSLATVAARFTHRPTGSSDDPNPEGPRKSTMISVTSTDLASGGAAVSSTSRPATEHREIFSTEISATAASHTGSTVHSTAQATQTAASESSDAVFEAAIAPRTNEEGDRRLHLGLQVGVGTGVPLLLLLVVVVAVVLLKHRKKLGRRSGQKNNMHSISIENPAYSAWDANERMTLSTDSDGNGTIQLE